MKKVICLILLLMTSNCFAGFLEASYRNMKINPTFVRCDSEMIDALDRVLDELKDDFLRLNEEFKDESRSPQAVRYRSQLNKVKNVLNCMSKAKFHNVKIYCESVRTTSSCKRINGFATWGIDIPILRISNNDIHLCREKFSSNISEMKSVVFHEISHNCGTDDVKYFFHKGRLERRGYVPNIAGWENNADHYEYFLFKGFNLPPFKK